MSLADEAFPDLTPGPARWVVPPPPDPSEVRKLAAALRLPEPLCRVLVARDIVRPDDAKRYLRPLLEHLHPPEGLRDASEAARRMLAAARGGETVLVHGDYDVDGVSAAALLTRWLRRLGAAVVPFVPHRLRDGYDFGEAGLNAARQAGASLIVTADCGVVANEWVGRATGEGIDVVVTDHHAPGDQLPDALAVVNPNRPDCPYPEKGLSGTGVAFKVISLVAREAGVPEEELLPSLELVALATVADLVPLSGENRVMVRHGLRALARTTTPGLRALLDMAELDEDAVDAGRVGYVIAPRINAAGRMGDADEALRLLLTDDPEEARRLARLLDDHNTRRREEDRRTLEEAMELLAERYDPERDYGVVLASEGWHPGVIGIVASRVVERIHRPVVMVALDGDTGRGSARSIPGFHLFDALDACREHMERFGGHRHAAGMDVRREALPALERAFNEEARRRLDPADLVPRIRVDLELPAGDPLQGLDLKTAHLMRHLGPHGVGNARPVFVARDVEVAGARVVGRGHLKLTLRRGDGVLEAIGFDLAERHPGLAPGDRVDVVFQLRVNEYRGRRAPQARLVDLRPAGREDDSAGSSEPSGSGEGGGGTG